METRRRSAQAPEAPPDNQRKKPKADTGAATTVTTNADPDVMALSIGLSPRIPSHLEHSSIQPVAIRRQLSVWVVGQLFLKRKSKLFLKTISEWFVLIALKNSTNQLKTLRATRIS